MDEGRADRLTWTLGRGHDAAIPEAMMPWLVKRQLGDGARSVIQALARYSKMMPA
ncbi:MAG: hypothetical protein HY002_01275 [Candidatus Rokubacteria bacterium]|nr:hypothetical protein [Candidatus Rokubacteria bacterium]